MAALVTCGGVTGGINDRRRSMRGGIKIHRLRQYRAASTGRRTADKTTYGGIS